MMLDIKARLWLCEPIITEEYSIGHMVGCVVEHQLVEVEVIDLPRVIELFKEKMIEETPNLNRFETELLRQYREIKKLQKRKKLFFPLKKGLEDAESSIKSFLKTLTQIKNFQREDISFFSQKRIEEFKIVFEEMKNKIIEVENSK